MGWLGICFRHAPTEFVLVAIIIVDATDSSVDEGGLEHVNKIIHKHTLSFITKV